MPMRFTSFCAMAVVSVVSAQHASAACTTWVQVPGCATNVTTSGKDDVWVVGCGIAFDKALWRYSPLNNGWIGLPGSGVQLSASGNDLWLRRIVGREIYKWSGSNWNGPLKDNNGSTACSSYIAASLQGSLWFRACGTTENQPFFLYHGHLGPAGAHPQGTFQQLPITGVQIADQSSPLFAEPFYADRESAWVTTAGGNASLIFHYPGTVMGVSEEIVQLMNGYAPALHAVKADGKIWRLNGETWTLVATPPGTVKSFSVNGSQIWTVNDTGNIYRCSLPQLPKPVIR
jgi:hypothetical protein